LGAAYLDEKARHPGVRNGLVSHQRADVLQQSPYETGNDCHAGTWRYRARSDADADLLVDWACRRMCSREEPTWPGRGDDAFRCSRTSTMARTSGADDVVDRPVTQEEHHR
jgi:hypothetical protein